MERINNKNVAISLFGFLKSKGYYPNDYELDGFIDHDEVFSVELDEGEVYRLTMPYEFNIENDSIMRKVIEEMYNVNVFNYFENKNDSYSDFLHITRIPRNAGIPPLRRRPKGFPIALWKPSDSMLVCFIPSFINGVIIL